MSHYPTEYNAIPAPSLGTKDAGKPQPEQDVSHKITDLTVEEAVAIQKWQLQGMEWRNPGITARVLAVSHPEQLSPGVRYPLAHIAPVVPCCEYLHKLVNCLMTRLE